MDERLRSDPQNASALINGLRALGTPQGLTIGPTPPAAALAAGRLDPLEGLPTELREEFQDLNASLNAQASVNMALQRAASVLPLVEAAARAMGIQFDTQAPGALEALREALKAYRKAWQDIAKRDAGEAVDTPSEPGRDEVIQAKDTFLRDVLPQWKSMKTRKPQTIKAAELALGLYEKATGNPPLGKLTRADGVSCRAWLRSQGMSDKTARDRFDYVKGFLNFACRELELIPRNPWEGLAIEYTTTKPRRPWSTEQLRSLVAKPLFASYELPTDWHAGGPAAYWIPLLGLFTGARMGELCQLQAADVETVDGVPVLRITDEGGEKSVKTAASRRMVPIHSELIRLGFLDYAASVKAGKGSLFPKLKLAPSKPSNYFSSWFSTLRTQDDGSRLPDFHSFRHTVRSRLASASVAEPMIDTLVGHEVRGSTGARVYTLRSLPDLQAAIELLTYPGVSLLRAFAA